MELSVDLFSFGLCALVVGRMGSMGARVMMGTDVIGLSVVLLCVCVVLQLNRNAIFCH